MLAITLITETCYKCFTTYMTLLPLTSSSVSHLHSRQSLPIKCFQCTTAALTPRVPLIFHIMFCRMFCNTLDVKLQCCRMYWLSCFTHVPLPFSWANRKMNFFVKGMATLTRKLQWNLYRRGHLQDVISCKTVSSLSQAQSCIASFQSWNSSWPKNNTWLPRRLKQNGMHFLLSRALAARGQRSLEHQDRHCGDSHRQLVRNATLQAYPLGHESPGF